MIQKIWRKKDRINEINIIKKCYELTVKISFFQKSKLARFMGTRILAPRSGKIVELKSIVFLVSYYCVPRLTNREFRSIYLEFQIFIYTFYSENGI